MTWYAWFIIFENGVMRAFRKHGAVSAETAATKSELGLESAPLFGHLSTRGVIKEPAPGRFYLDLGEQTRYLCRRRWATVCVAVGLVGLALLLAAIRA
jgi:hypothetical protein